MRKSLLTILAAVLLTACQAGEVSLGELARRAGEGDAKATGELITLMGAGDRAQADGAYQAVVDLGEAAIPYLVKALRENNGPVVEASAAALGSIGDPSAIQSLVAAMAPDRPRRYAAAWALGEIASGDTAEALAAILADEDANLRKSAVRALVKIGQESEAVVLDHLEAAQGGPGQRASIMVLGELRSRRAVPLLAGITGDNRDAAAWALGRSGDAGALDPLLSALEDDRWLVRRHAAEALGSLENSEAVPALENMLEDEEAVVREWTARSLETLTGERVLYRDEYGELEPPYNLYR
jgi:HEAT repeat protein